MAKESGTQEVRTAGTGVVIPQKEDRIAEFNAKPVVGSFQVMEGFHNEGGKTYEKGEVVESRSNLDRFPEKFRRIDEKTGHPVLASGPPKTNTMPPDKNKT